MATFTVEIPPEVKNLHHYTVRIDGRSAVPMVLGRKDLNRARAHGCTVHRWDDTDASDTPVILTRFDKGGRNTHLYVTYRCTRVACKVCADRGGKSPSWATHYALLVGKGMNTTGAFPICDDHLTELQRQTAGGRITVHLSERLFIGLY